MKNRKLISVIGLDGSGKDTVANMIYEHYHEKFYKTLRLSNADPLKSFVCKFLQIKEEWYEDLKRNESATFQGKTIREWMIFFAEDCFKPTFGKTFFASCTLKEIMNNYSCEVFIKSDDRYTEEFQSNSAFEQIGKVEYILVIKDESDYSFFNQIDFDHKVYKNKPYLYHLWHFVKGNLEKIHIVYNNDGKKDLNIKVNNICKSFGV